MKGEKEGTNKRMKGMRNGMKGEKGNARVKRRE